MRAGANLPAVGGYTQIVVLDAIRRAPEGVSRVEIASRTRLSAQTVSTVCTRLIELGLVAETGTVSAGVGMPHSILRLEPRSRFAIGVHLDPPPARGRRRREDRAVLGGGSALAGAVQG